jgi:hypothetical protein
MLPTSLKLQRTRWWTSDAREVVYGDCDPSAVLRAGCAQGRPFSLCSGLRLAILYEGVKKDAEMERFYLTGKWMIWYKKDGEVCALGESVLSPFGFPFGCAQGFG